MAYKCRVNRFLILRNSCICTKFTPLPISEDSLLTGILEKTNESYAIAKIAGIKLFESLKNNINSIQFP